MICCIVSLAFLISITYYYFPKTTKYYDTTLLPRDLHNLNAERSANLRGLNFSDYFHRNRSPQSIRRRFSAIHNFCINKQLRFSSFLRVPELANLFVSFSGKYSTRCIFHDSDETVDTLTFIDSHPAITEICNFRSSPKTWNCIFSRRGEKFTLVD